MSNKPKISLIMKVYNGERYLREAIDSILAQTFRDFELLIIDDGSTDGSADIVRGYSDARIRFLQNERNMGLCATQNRALEEARGAYIAVMDSDDISYPTRFERQVEFLETHEDVVMCGSFRNNLVDGVETAFLPVEDYTDATLRFSLCYGNMFFTHSSIMFRAEAYREHHLVYGPAKLAEDYQYIIKLAGVGKLALLPEKLIAYRIYNQSTSNQRKRELDEQAKQIRSDYIKALCMGEKYERSLLAPYEEQSGTADFFETIHAVAEHLGADISRDGNAYGVACRIVRDFVLAQERYDMKLWRAVRASGYGSIFRSDRLLGIKTYVACLLRYTRKGR